MNRRLNGENLSSNTAMPAIGISHLSHVALLDRAVWRLHAAVLSLLAAISAKIHAGEVPIYGLYEVELELALRE